MAPTFNILKMAPLTHRLNCRTLNSFTTSVHVVTLSYLSVSPAGSSCFWNKANGNWQIVFLTLPSSFLYNLGFPQANFSVWFLLHTGYLFDLFCSPINRGDMLLRNGCWLLPGYKALYSRRQNSLFIEYSSIAKNKKGLSAAATCTC
jgi:hypothetical protein